MKKKCDYCGENKPMITIPNPNFDEDNLWEVCLTCDEVIKNQMNLSFGMMLSEKSLGKEIGNKLIKDASKRLNEISYESDIPIMSASFHGKETK